MKEEIRKLVKEAERRAGVEGNFDPGSGVYIALCAAIREMDLERERERAAWIQYVDASARIDLGVLGAPSIDVVTECGRQNRAIDTLMNLGVKSEDLPFGS